MCCIIGTILNIIDRPACIASAEKTTGAIMCIIFRRLEFFYSIANFDLLLITL